jgi:PEGA domain
MAAAAVAWLLAAPSPVAAQHSGHGGGGSRSSGGHASGGGQSGGHSSGDGQSGSSAPRGGSVQRAPSGDGGTRTGGGTTTARGSSGDGAEGGTTTSSGGGAPVPPYSRPRGGRPVTGQAVPRTSQPPITGGGPTIFVPGGYYPWGYGGVGIGGYYGGWYGGGYQGYQSGGGDYEGRLRLKVKPKEAEVFVDGYFAGIVDDFDGVFQRLHIETGPHRIELRADGYEPLSFEVNIEPGRTLTYKGELKKLPEAPSLDRDPESR